MNIFLFIYSCFSRLTSCHVIFCQISELNSIWEKRNKLLCKVFNLGLALIGSWTTGSWWSRVEVPLWPPAGLVPGISPCFNLSATHGHSQLACLPLSGILNLFSSFVVFFYYIYKLDPYQLMTVINFTNLYLSNTVFIIFINVKAFNGSERF